ncbi:MAG: hypothetical protein U0R68_03185 [Candidatus Nanopelagicales bacterium]
MTGLAALVAAAPGSLVLPAGDRRAAVEVREPLRLLDSADLGSGRHVAVVEDADGGRWTVPLAVDGSDVRRARPGDGVAEALLRGLADVHQAHRTHEAVRTPEGAAVQGSAAFVADAWYAEDVAGERGITVDQTNESVVVGDRAMVKWAVHLPPAGVTGAQPAGDRLAALAEAGFTETPRPWGLLHWSAPDGTTTLLASVTSYLEGAEDGWDWAVADVDGAALHRTSLDEALAAPKRLGALTARMHVALAAHGVQQATADDVVRWETEARADLDEALRLVDGEEGERLRARADRIAAAYDGFAQHVGTPLVPVHGDYHVGQVLRTPSADPTLRFDYAVTDFDGNPVRPPAERSAPQPAALDAVGMLASLDHVGRVVLERTEGADPDVVRTWIAAAQEAFRYEYVDTLARTRHAHLLDEGLVVPLRLAQEVREFLYAAKHLPHWRYVPDGALRDLLPDV